MEEVSEKKKKIEIVFDKIKKGITEIIKSGEYEKFLEFSKNFHSYSFNNMVLIYIQMPTATKVAGFKTWQKMGRKIKYGTKGIQIIYPIKQKYEKKVLDNDEEKREVIEYITYRATYVYDISQTTGKKLPFENEVMNTNTKKDLFYNLCAFSPFQIKENEGLGKVQGYWNPKEKCIVLNKMLSIDDKASTLLHELTHAFYDDFNYKSERNLSETFVESVAYIVADHFGLDTSSCSFKYILSWIDGDINILLELGEKIQKTANEFIKRLENYMEIENIKVAG